MTQKNINIRRRFIMLIMFKKNRNYSATKYGIFATDCTNLRKFKTTKGGLLAKID